MNGRFWWEWNFENSITRSLRFLVYAKHYTCKFHELTHHWYKGREVNTKHPVYTRTFPILWFRYLILKICDKYCSLHKVGGRGYYGSKSWKKIIYFITNDSDIFTLFEDGDDFPPPPSPRTPLIFTQKQFAERII